MAANGKLATTPMYREASPQHPSVKEFDMSKPFFEGFLDGFTGGGLYTELRRPGAATQVFADEDEEQSPPEEKCDHGE